jgi:hypothetical protein
MESVKALPLISAALKHVNTARARFVASFLRDKGEAMKDE